MVYRPTVRYDDRFREYIEELFQATDLDRNQLFRAALLFLGSEGEGKTFLTSHLREGALLPPPLSERYPEYGLWECSEAVRLEGGGTSHMNEGGTSGEEYITGTHDLAIIDERGTGRRIYLGGRDGEAQGPKGAVRPGVGGAQEQSISFEIRVGSRVVQAE